MPDNDDSPKLKGEKKKSILEYLERASEGIDLFRMSYNGLLDKYGSEYGKSSLDSILSEMEEADEVKERSITASIYYPPSSESSVSEKLKDYSKPENVYLSLAFGGFATAILFNQEIFTDFLFNTLSTSENISRPYLVSLVTVMSTFVLGISFERLWYKIQKIVPSIRAYSPILRPIGVITALYVGLIIGLSIVPGISLNSTTILAGLPTCVVAGYYLFKWKNDYLED